LPTATLTSATTENAPLPVHVGEAATVGGTGGGTIGGGADGVESPPLPHAVRTMMNSDASVTRIDAMKTFMVRSDTQCNEQQ
jgi:hypothetical protein